MSDINSAFRRDSEDTSFARWNPEQVGNRAAAIRTKTLARHIQQLISDFCKDRLRIEERCSATESTEHMIETIVSVEGFDFPLTCRMQRADAIAICAAACGVARANPIEVDAVHVGRIGEVMTTRLMETFVDLFCEAASAAGRRDIRRKTNDEMGSAPIGKLDAAKIDIPIFIEPIMVKIGFEIASADFDTIDVVGVSGNVEGWTADHIARLHRDVSQVTVCLNAVLVDRQVTLSEMKTWSRGSHIDLESTPTSIAELVVGGQSLFECELARNNGYFALRLIGDCEETLSSDRRE